GERGVRVVGQGAALAALQDSPERSGESEACFDRERKEIRVVGQRAADPQKPLLDLIAQPEERTRRTQRAGDQRPGDVYAKPPARNQAHRQTADGADLLEREDVEWPHLPG